MNDTAMEKENEYGSMILPDGKYYSLDDRETRLNNNVLVVGTSGSSKTRAVVTPNLLECIGSYVVTDAKGNLYRKWGNYMEKRGYRVVRLSFIHPEQSVHYNPLHYVSTTQQIMQMSSALVYSDGGCARDPFWDESSLMLTNSIIALIKETIPANFGRHNFHYVLELMRQAGRTSDSDKNSGLSLKMEKARSRNPKSWAYKQFCNVNQAADKTFSTILAVAIANFCTVDTEELAAMMHYDEIDLQSIGKRKTAVFVEVSDTDRSMDMLINMFFTQCMNQLCTYADEECADNQLLVPVRFMMDDFATNCRIDNFEKMISNIRSR